MPRNATVEEAIALLSERPSDETRLDFYRKVSEGELFLAVAELPPGMGLGWQVLEEDAELSVLTSSGPGGGEVLLAFTDERAVQQRAPGVPFVAMPSRRVLETVMDLNLDGIILNPAGPWAGIPREDVENILGGAFSQGGP